MAEDDERRHQNDVRSTIFFALFFKAPASDFTTMDISRTEQRILHLLAQGGRIELIRNEDRKIERVDCYNREGWRYPGVDLCLFRKLKAKRAIRSQNGRPYLITQRGLELVRSQPDNT